MPLLFVFNIDLSPGQPQTTKLSLVQIVFWANLELLNGKRSENFSLHILPGPHFANPVGILNSSSGTEACDLIEI